LRLPNSEDPLPNRAGESWRMWLMTGVRRGAVDRRRVRGAHVGIKRMLVEGMRVTGDKPYTWKEFSDAMVRQAVGDAMQTLSYRDSQLVKLAYFSGLSNREIADHMHMTEATVQRRLRLALDAISRFVERGRGLGHRILVALAIWLSGRTASETIHGAAQGVVIATAAAVIATHPGAIAVVEHHSAPATPATHVSAPDTAPVTAPVPSPTAPVTAPVPAEAPAVQAPSASVPSVQVPSVQAPAVQLPTVPVPQLPQVPAKVKKIL
jgi:Sigma-70, region 4